jgi:uncharacterized protein (DUF983 family)
VTPAAGPQIFTCPRCRETYWGTGTERLPDCPHCGYDYRKREGFRFDLVFLMVMIIAMFGFLLLTASYKSGTGRSPASPVVQEEMPEKLPGR